MSKAAGAADDRCVEFRFSGLTRYQIGCLLLLYNTYIQDSDLSREGPVKVLMSVIALMGIGITEKEAQRITQTFSRTRDLESFKRLTFRQFLDFFSWFFSDPIAVNLLSFVDHQLNSGYLKDDVLKGFVEAVTPKGKWNREVLFEDNNFLIEFMNRPPPDIDNAPIDISFELTLQNLFGLLDFKYVGLDSDVATLDFFVRVEFCGQEYTTKVRSAGVIPMIGESFKFHVEIPGKAKSGHRTVSFLDATWWLQNTAVKIRVYGVHFIDVKVAYHLLGCADIPLITLLSGRDQLVSFAVNVDPIMPYKPMTLLVSTLAHGENSVAIHSMPLEAIVVQKYFRQIARLISPRPGDEQARAPPGFVSKLMDAFKEAFSKYPDREYQIFGFDEYNRMYPLTSFVLMHEDLRMISKDSASFVRKMSYLISLHSPSLFARESPKIMQIRSLATIEASGVEMSEMERAIYLCSLLQSNGIEHSYVCVGAHHWQRYVCVLCIFDKAITLGSAECDECPHHIYSLEEFWQHLEREKVPSVSSRLVGLHQVKLADWVNPIFLANAPSKESEDLEFESEMGQDKSCDLEENQTDSKTTRVKLIPVTGWYSNGISVPSGFEVGSIFNHKHMYLYKGPQRDFTLWTNGKLLANGEEDPTQFLSDKARWNHVEVNTSGCAYGVINWHSWLRREHKPDLADRICGLWETIRAYTLQETRITRVVKCLKLLISYLVRLIWKSYRKRFEVAEKGRVQKKDSILSPEKFVSALVEFLRNSANKCLVNPEMTVYKVHVIIEQLLFGNFAAKESPLQGDIGQREIFIVLYLVCLWIRDLKTHVSGDKPEAKFISELRMEYSTHCAHDAMLPHFSKSGTETLASTFIQNSVMQNHRIEGWPDTPLSRHNQYVWAYAADICGKLKLDPAGYYMIQEKKNEGDKVEKVELPLAAVLGLWVCWYVNQLAKAKPGQSVTIPDFSEQQTYIGAAGQRLQSYLSNKNQGKFTILMKEVGGFQAQHLSEMVEALKVKKQKEVEFPAEWDGIAWSNLVPVELEILRAVFSQVEEMVTRGEKDQKALDQKKHTLRILLGGAARIECEEVIQGVTTCEERPPQWAKELENLSKGFPRDEYESDGWSQQMLENLESEPMSFLTKKQLDRGFRAGLRRMDGVLASCNLARLLKIDVAIRTLEFRKPFSVLEKNDLQDFAYMSYWQADVDRLPKGGESGEQVTFDEPIEDYMLMYVQRQLVAMEKALKRMERIDVKCEEMDGYTEMQREIERLLTLIIDEQLSGTHPTRYMLRVTKHNTGDPRIIAEELKRSGLLTSAIGAQCVYLVAQPFFYRMRAETSWVALIFLYPVPLPIKRNTASVVQTMKR